MIQLKYYLRRQPIRRGNRPAGGENPALTAQADPIKERNAQWTNVDASNNVKPYNIVSTIERRQNLLSYCKLILEKLWEKEFVPSTKTINSISQLQ